jgi:anti-sigma regulatory factor (Ser/Thr protein kinase)
MTLDEETPMERAQRHQVHGQILREAFGTWQADSSTPRSAREIVSALLRGMGCDDLVDDALLLTSELVTNAVIHATGAVALHAELHDDGLRVAVHDQAPDLATPRPRPVDAEEHGRGLAIVEQVAAAWSSEVRSGGGKVTWFELTRAGVQ